MCYKHFIDLQNSAAGLHSQPLLCAGGMSDSINCRPQVSEACRLVQDLPTYADLSLRPAAVEEELPRVPVAAAVPVPVVGGLGPVLVVEAGDEVEEGGGLEAAAPDAALLPAAAPDAALEPEPVDVGLGEAVLDAAAPVAAAPDGGLGPEGVEPDAAADPAALDPPATARSTQHKLHSRLLVVWLGMESAFST